MGFWRIDYITKSKGDKADEYCNLLSAALIRTMRKTNPAAWEQFKAILREVKEAQ